MTLRAKQWIIFTLGLVFLASLIFVQWQENIRRSQELGKAKPAIHVSAESKKCVDCHREKTPGILDHWEGSKHAMKGVGCYDCHKANEGDIDAFNHEGAIIATIVTPKDCSVCHEKETKQFLGSHHSRAGNILASLDNILAETVEGNREPFNPHSPTPGRDFGKVNGMSSVNSGCKQCHGSKIAIKLKDGGVVNFDSLFDKDGKSKGDDVLASFVSKVKKDKDGIPVMDYQTWPNTGIGRFNLDGSRGSCTACHSRHDFSPRRARQPENCGKCHLGPDHPQKEIYEESKHGVAYRDMKEHMNLNAEEWVLGKDYNAAPTCATCHMSANSKGGVITHDPGTRLSWTNRPPISLAMDTDEHGHVIKNDPKLSKQENIARRRDLLTKGEGWQKKRTRMKNVCSNCHTPNYINNFYEQYDNFVVNFNEKFAKPGKKLIGALKKNGLITKQNFDEEIEFTWFYIWHHEGRRARHGASMMAPDYAHWHGMYEVSERFYHQLIPQALEICEKAEKNGQKKEAEAVHKVIDDLLARPEHKWFMAQKKIKEAGAADSEKVKAEKPKEEAPAEPAAPAAEAETPATETPATTEAESESAATPESAPAEPAVTP